MPIIQLFKDKPLTRLELHEINMRIDEISELFDLTDDEDIIENLEAELEQLNQKLERSLKAAERLERLSI